MKHPIMADFELQVVGLFRRSDPTAELVRRDGLARRADVVSLAFHRHQRGAFDGCRLDPLSPHSEAAARQIVVVKYPWEPQHLAMTRDFIFRNTFADIERILKDLGEGCGTRFEFECYDVGHLYNLAHFLDRGMVNPPLFVQTIFGILGGIGADPENLVHMKRIADKLFGDSYAWSILAAGRHQLPLVSMGAIMGGNVRVGLEDSLWIGRGKLARSNADQVSAIRAIVENLSLEIASPDEARAMLALKGGDAVAF